MFEQIWIPIDEIIPSKSMCTTIYPTLSKTYCVMTPRLTITMSIYDLERVDKRLNRNVV